MEVLDRHQASVEALIGRQNRLVYGTGSHGFGRQISEDVEKRQSEQLRRELMKALEIGWRKARNECPTSYLGAMSVGQAIQLLDQIWAFGPKKARLNMLFNVVADYQQRPQIWHG